MMPVERAVLALLLLVSQGTGLVSMPGGKAKGSKNPAGSRRPGPENRTDKRRNLAIANENSSRR